MINEQAPISQGQREPERELLLGQMRSNLDQEMIALVQVLWEEKGLAPDSRSAASMLAMNLCADDLNLASLFEEDRTRMSHVLMQAISFVVAGLDQPQTLVPYLGSLGQLLRRHGLHKSGPQKFSNALYLTLGESLGPRYGPVRSNTTIGRSSTVSLFES